MSCQCYDDGYNDGYQDGLAEKKVEYITNSQAWIELKSRIDTIIDTINANKIADPLDMGHKGEMYDNIISTNKLIEEIENLVPED